LRPIEDKDIEEQNIDKEIEEKKLEEKNIEKEIEEKCFFCKKKLTRDKLGIRPICPICLGELYGLARESHKSQEC
jgi:hypothetical protein